MQTSKWYPLYRFGIYVGDIEPQIPTLSINPSSLQFNEVGESKSIQVMITNQPEASYSIIGLLPSWLTISNKTQDGFILTAIASDIDVSRSVILTVKLDNYESQATLEVSQLGAWLSQFIFDVVTTVSNEYVARIVNLGAIASGEAQFDYGDGTAIEIKPVPKSTEIHTVDGNGNSVTILVGEDFGHLFPAAGTHTVTIQVRQGVNAFRFSTVPEGSVGDWGAEFVQNDYIRAIRKVKSNSLTSGYKMFAGCRKAFFAPQWDGLETPNMTDFGFMYENFGNWGSGNNGAFNVNDRLRFPENTYQFISNTSKSQIHGLTRTYFGSGFEKIEKSMLSCAADGALTSLFETFRGMGNVGANWTAKYGNPDSQGRHIIDWGDPHGNNLVLEEFVETDLIWNQPNICNFTGTFNAINDYYGLYDSGYSYKWMLKKDFFKNNAASYLILDSMFNKCTRMILENGFFADIAQKVHSMWLCFHGFNEGTPRVASDMSIEGFNGADLLKMFPDAQYPNMGKNPQGVPTAGYHMAGAFDFLPYNPQDNGGAGFGFQGLPFASGYWYGDNQKFNTDFFYWRYPSENLRKNSLNIWAFLQKFPNVTPASGLDPRDMQTVIDGAAYNFGNYTQKDDNGVSKSDATTFAASHPERAQVIQNINLN